MAYGRVRASSPTEAHLFEEEPKSSPQEDRQGSVATAGADDHDAGQHERLLAQEERDVEKPLRRRPLGILKHRPRVVAALSVIIVFSIVLFDIWLLLEPDSALSKGGTSSASFRRPDEDYLLDPQWNFNAPSQVRRYNWTIVDKIENPDGVYKPMMMINGQFPGPLMEANEGDTIVVDVHNRAENATAIHWHGIFQNGTNFMDGTSGVTQCPIAPGHSFQYKFTVTGQAGTYFYHGHQGVQRLDGLVGPLVIHDRNEVKDSPLRYETDRVVLLSDWYYDPGPGLLRETLSPGNEASPIPNAALINGLNQVDCSLHPNRRCDATGTLLPTMNLTSGASHRLRFMNVGGFAWFQVSVDEHLTLPVVEIDGTSVEPAPESDIVMSPGQRYSVVMTADQEGRDAFWLRARMIKACFAEPKLPEDGVDEAKAVIRYLATKGSQSEKDSTSLSMPTTQNTNTNYPMTCKDMGSSTSYRPSPPAQAPAYADHSWYMRVNLAIGDWRLERGFFNRSSFRGDLQRPTLHRILDGLASSNESFNVEGVNTAAFSEASELVVSHKRTETVDIILQNMDEGNHPFHLHGMQMWILGAGHGYFPGYEALGLRAEGKGLLDPSDSTVIANPLKRDTATAEGFGWVLLRFVADNPGVWFFHCHMIWHSEAGMGMQFVSRLDEMKEWKLPDASKRLCQFNREELEKGAPPKDEIFYGFHDKLQ